MFRPGTDSVRCVASPQGLALCCATLVSPITERALHTHEQTKLPASPCAWPKTATAQRTRNCSASSFNGPFTCGAPGTIHTASPNPIPAFFSVALASTLRDLQMELRPTEHARAFSVFLQLSPPTFVILVQPLAGQAELDLTGKTKRGSMSTSLHCDSAFSVVSRGVVLGILCVP